MHIFGDIPIICDEQEQELGFRHLKGKASPFFTYLVIACVKPVGVFSAWCTERKRQRDNTEVGEKTN